MGIVGFPPPIWCHWLKNCLKLVQASSARRSIWNSPMALWLPTASARPIASFWQVSIEPSRPSPRGYSRFPEPSYPGTRSTPIRHCPGSSIRISLELAPSQKAAVRLALASKVLVITGGPGVGKTTIVNAILRILAAKTVKLLLCAPTGRAAKRLNETTGQEAKTIHRLLEVDPKGGGFKRNVENPLDCDLLVLDETSMVDVLLMHALLKAVPETAALL